jgi:hypothetical protein
LRRVRSRDVRRLRALERRAEARRQQRRSSVAYNARATAREHRNARGAPRRRAAVEREIFRRSESGLHRFEKIFF